MTKFFLIPLILLISLTLEAEIANHEKNVYNLNTNNF
jgi:hypothetical protein